MLELTGDEVRLALLVSNRDRFDIVVEFRWPSMIFFSKDNENFTDCYHQSGILSVNHCKSISGEHTIDRCSSNQTIARVLTT